MGIFGRENASNSLLFLRANWLRTYFAGCMCVAFAPLHVVSRKRAVLIEEDKERAYIPTYRFRDPMTVENGTCRLLPDRLMLRGTQVVVKRHKLPRYLTGT